MFLLPAYNSGRHVTIISSAALFYFIYLFIFQKIKCTPQNNTIILVNRFSNMEVYNKYCKKVDGHSWTVIVATYLIKNVFDCSLSIEKL